MPSAEVLLLGTCLAQDDLAPLHGGKGRACQAMKGTAQEMWTAEDVLQCKGGLQWPLPSRSVVAGQQGLRALQRPGSAHRGL